MAYKIVYRSNASLNIIAAKAWYKQQQDGLQLRFSAAIKDAILRVQNNPEAFSIRYRNVRIAAAHRFPFNIHFYIDKLQSQIVITNIIHDRRDFNTH